VVRRRGPREPVVVGMRALVCGAGVAGLALAERLAVHGWEVTLVERAPGPHEQGYMLDFFGPGFDAAEATGVLPRLRELAYRVDEVSYVDPQRGRRRAGLGYDGFARAVGGRLLSLMRPDLELALRERLPAGVDLRHGCTVTGVETHPDGVRARLTGGATIEADLLVGADGIHSAVRRAVFGDERRFSRYLGFHTAAWVFDDEEVRRRIGSRFALTDTLDRQVGLYALRDGQVAAFAVHREPDPRLPADTRAVLRSTYAGFGWAVPRALERCPPPSALYYDRVAQVEVPQWHRGRVVLVGDACQAVSLLAGQGASLAVAGAYVLGERLAAAGSVEGALAGYERVWRPVVEAKQEVGRRGARWFLPSSTARLLMRRALLHLAALPGGRRVVGRGLVGRPDPPLARLVGA
jgi:2-polyprenyl-6-methoxyphenol hydroxylase-like FAD-dependent oxidoreductase